jgi:hypothetical protein
MKTKEILGIALGLGFLTVLFFNKTVIRGWVPFPGDSLIAEYKPFSSSSYLGYSPGGYPHKAQYPDTLRQLYPWRSAAISQWKKGDVPLWNPYNFAGSPLLANFQSAALYPLNALFWVLPHVDAWSVLIILQPLLAALFTYLFARKIGLTQFGSALSSLSYGFSAFVSVWLEYNTVGHVILWLPFLLLAVEHMAEKPTLWWLAAYAAALTMSLLAGHPQVFAYMLAFVLAYALFRVRNTRDRMWIGGVSVLGIGMAAVQLVPGAELIRFAARSPHEFGNLFEKILIQPWQLLSLPFPNIFGNPATRTYWPADTFVAKVTSIGLVPLFFLPSAWRDKSPVSRFFLWAAVGVVLLITANPVTYFLYKLPIPLVSSSSPTLMSFLLAFALAVFTGFGMDFWIRDKHSVNKLMKRTLQVGALLGGIALLTQIPVFPAFTVHSPIALRALLYAAGVSAATLGLWYAIIKYKKWKLAALAILLLVHAADLFVFFNRFNPFVPKALIFPDHEIITSLRASAPDRFWGYGTAAIWANFATQYQIFDPQGYDPLYPRWYGELLHGSYDGKLLTSFDNVTRSDATIAPGFGEDGFASPTRKRILDATSVRWILNRTENGATAVTFPPPAYRQASSSGEWQIIENTASAPRAFLTTHIVTYENRDDFGKKFFDPAFDPARQVLLPVAPPLTYPLDTAGTAAISAYDENEVTITTKSNSPAVLVLTDTYYPGWKAWVDGKETGILRANWAFRAVPVPQGEHTVRMQYVPVSYSVGKTISIISFIALGVVLMWRKLHV